MTTLEAILASQHRLIRTQQALAAGLTKAEIAAFARRGEWRRELRGIYAVEPLADDRFVIRCHAALLYAGSEAAVSHLTALSLLAGRIQCPEITHVSHAARSVSATPGLAVHWVAAHGPLTLVRGVVTVSPPAAVVGSWSSLDGLDERRAMVCAAVSDLRVQVDGVIAEMERPIRVRDRAGLERACQLVALGCHSPLEMRYYETIERGFGLPHAERQVAITVGSGRLYRVDVAYRRERVIVELDGSQHWLTPDARHADLLRDAELQAAGYVVLRFTWRDVTERPWWVAATVRASLATRDFGLGEVVNS